MKTIFRFLKNVVIVLVLCVIGGAVVLAGAEGSYALYKHMAPKWAALDNEIFHNTPAYTEGGIHDLEKYRIEYIQADKSQKLALRQAVLHQFEVYPEDKLPAELRDFYFQLRNERN
jgi:hypothetical protein